MYVIFHHSAIGCGANFSLPGNSVVQVTSPNYPNSYPNNADCLWLFVLPTGRRFRVVFDNFTTEANYDHLQVINLCLISAWYFVNTLGWCLRLTEILIDDIYDQDIILVSLLILNI